MKLGGQLIAASKQGSAHTEKRKFRFFSLFFLEWCPRADAGSFPVHSGVTFTASHVWIAVILLRGGKVALLVLFHPSYPTLNSVIDSAKSHHCYHFRPVWRFSARTQNIVGVLLGRDVCEAISDSVTATNHFVCLSGSGCKRTGRAVKHQPVYEVSHKSHHPDETRRGGEKNTYLHRQ